ncbi:MAG: hypothetical protein LBC09_05460, partial [Helicobacteraceae bacterium]|nr:hypothetical protein [Helicobacteraceae bacterium]
MNPFKRLILAIASLKAFASLKTLLLALLKRPSVILRIVAFIFILAYIIAMYSDRTIGDNRYSKR